ncbi:MAG: DUF1343 domain-containing protein [Flavobacteriaceae bacterium]|nr:DUF1343 domain-containing protein [Flavobacteriaceae bacterium]
MEIFTLDFKISLFALCALIFSCQAQEKKTIDNSEESLEIITGAEQLNMLLEIIAGKKIAMVANQSSVVFEKNTRKPIHLIDSLLKHKAAIQKVFAPEHGFRGTADAGELIKDGKDTKTGIPIISLYGDNKKPKPKQLTDVELIVFDLQDVGVRFYTYISTLHYVLEAAAEENIPVIVLDRPNPNIQLIDGPILDKKHQSFVGMHSVPVLYGMTIGEYAQMIKGEQWINQADALNLQVIPLKNYQRTSTYELPVKPSPNLPNAQSIALYPSLCFFEGTDISVGRGTNKQFQIFGAPYLKNTAIFNYEFMPMPNVGARNPKHKTNICFGLDLSNEEHPKRLELKWLVLAYKNSPNKKQFFNAFFEKLAGTENLRKQIEAGVSLDQIYAGWQPELERFKKLREPYLLYPE